MFSDKYIVALIADYLTDEDAFKFYSHDINVKKMQYWYRIKSVVDIDKYDPSQGIITKVWWSPNLFELPFKIPNTIITRIDDYWKNPNPYMIENRYDVEVNNYGYGFEQILFKKKRMLHREDGPAAISIDGNYMWFRNGKYHRINGPAIIQSDGTQEWYRNGVRHRDDGPAVIRTNGHHEWYQNGQRHRDHNEAAIIYSNGTREWYQHDKRHRENGPAFIDYNGTMMWYRHGKLHRDDGPAVIYSNGSQEWYLDSVKQEYINVIKYIVKNKLTWLFKA